MGSSTGKGRRHTAYGMVAVLLMQLMACDRQMEDPTQPSFATGRSPEAAEHFYYYDGRRLALDIDPTRLIIDASSEPDARANLAAAGLRPTRLANVGRPARHWIVELPGTPEQSLGAAVRAIRARPDAPFVSHAYRLRESGAAFVPVNRLVVRFREGAGAGAANALVAALGVRLLREPNADSAWFTHWFEYPAGADPLVVAAAAQEHPLVEWAEPDAFSDWRSATADPYFAQQFYLKSNILRNGIPVDINAERAWQFTKGSASIYVAVIDEGMDARHPEIGNRMSYGLDKTNIGAVCPSCTDSPFLPYQDDSHGTLVAGVIAAEQDNGYGMAGIAPNVRLNSVRIFRGTYTATSAEIADGLNWAWDVVDSDVLNNSWGCGSPSTAITTQINRATTLGRGGKGAAVVFSGGNDSRRSVGNLKPACYPAYLDAVIGVGAIDRYGNPADYTPEDSRIDIVAPSGAEYLPCPIDGILSTDIVGWAGCNGGPDGDPDFTLGFNGTSAAAPQVAAVAALLLSLEPNLTWAQVKARILDNADRWGPFSTFGRGKLNAGRAIRPPLRVAIGGPAYLPAPGTASWWADVYNGSGGTTYRWQESYDGVTFYDIPGATSDTYSAYVAQSFTLRLIVTSGGETATADKPVLCDFCQ